MATNFSPCKGSYVLNQFPSNVMFGMNGFHVSASGAIQGHHGPLVFESKAYTKDVMVKNQHFRCYHENKEIEYFQKFKSFMHFNSVYDVPEFQLPPDNASANC